MVPRPRAFLLICTLTLLPAVAPVFGAGSGFARAAIRDRARPNTLLTEGDMAALVARTAQQLSTQTPYTIDVQHPAAPVSRLRVLAALVKVALAPERMRSYRKAPPEWLPPDADGMPSWGKPFAAAAVAQGWWPAEWPLRGRQPATWHFVEVILSRMGAAGDARGDAAEPDSEPYTGLVVDARALDLERAMGPRILDEEGEVLYPDPRQVPTPDQLQNEGMASYVTDVRSAPRAGSHPLIVRAVDSAGPGRDDLVVSNAAAQQIPDADERGHFLKHWAVSILLDRR